MIRCLTCIARGHYGQSVSCTRRTVLVGLGAGSALGALGCTRGTVDHMVDAPGSAACTSVVCLSLSDPANAPLKTVGGAIAVPAPKVGDTILVVRTSATQVAAVSDICTHRGCSLSWNATADLAVCPCHGSEFDLTGAVLKGPAVVPIKVYSATLDTAANTIDITS
jgi:cytochrome b6-f complex iron-sulfur subunit